MDFVLENLRLLELVAVVNANRDYYDEFVQFLNTQGYASVIDFVNEPGNEQATQVIKLYLASGSSAELYDGILRPYPATRAKWFFLSWLMRDAATQRLQPLLSSVPGVTDIDRKSYLLNEVRKFVAPLFPKAESWEWPAIAEVMLARLEGSRRALKGTLFEGIIRRSLTQVIEANGLALTVGESQIRLDDETYDVQVSGEYGTLLMPVKTRETMGGGHALLFTRDIFKSIMVARNQGYRCIPIVIAESWSGDLETLNSTTYIYIQANPNQIILIEPIITQELRKLLPILQALTVGD